MNNIQILKRLYSSYTKKYLKNILISVFFTVLLAASTSSVAYLLDPAIKQLFIEQKQSYIYLIPALIILAFGVKGLSLYLAKIIMIGVSEDQLASGIGTPDVWCLTLLLIVYSI